MAWKKGTPIEKIREYNRQYYQRKVKEKRAEERATHIVKKECPICHTIFTPDKPNKKYCCEECKKVSIKIKGNLYRRSQEYKDKLKEYRHSDEFKEKQKAYRQTEKYKAYRKEYAKTKKYKEIAKRYLQSEKGKATMQRYAEKAKANGWKPLGTGKET